MTVATMKQAGAVLDRILETDESVEGVQRLLSRWSYVQVLWRAGELPNIDLFKKFLAGELEIVTRPAWNAIWQEAMKENWLKLLVEREARIHKVRGTKWNCDLFIETALKYGMKKIQEWERKFLLRFSALPILNLAPDVEFDWWKVKPNKWYYERVEAGEIGHMIEGKFQPDREAFQLRGEIVLIDTRLKPTSSDGRRMWPDDELFCGRVLNQLRECRSIPRYEHGPQGSRFSVAANPDWQDHIRPALAELLGLESVRVRLERVMEGNMIPQFYFDLPRVQDCISISNAWVWYEEHFKGVDFRLSGGDSIQSGLAPNVHFQSGLANVHFSCSDHRWDYQRSFRPLTVLSGV